MALMYLVLVSMTTFLRPLFNGYLDCVGELLLFCIIAAIFDKELPLRRKGAVGIGLGVAGTFLIRRWYIFAVIGLTVSAIVYWVAKLISAAKNERIALAKNVLIVAVIICIAALLPLLIFFPGFVKRSLFGNFSSAYSAYNAYSHVEKWLNIGDLLGWAWLFASWVAVVFLIVFAYRNKDVLLGKNMRKDVLILIPASYIGGAIALLIFWRVQDLSPQHWYIVIPFIDIAVFLPIFLAIAVFPQKVARRLTQSLIGAAAIFGLLTGFTIIPTNVHVEKLIGFPVQTPYVQGDVGEKGKFTNYLYEQTGGKDLIYFAAASSNLNEGLPSSYSMLEGLNQSFSTTSANVDSRDGFNPAFFDAQYVVASSPVSIHMSPENEQVVVGLNTLVQDKSGYVGKHYTKKKTFYFDDNYEVYVYEKISPYTVDDVKAVEAYFDKIYPDDPDMYKNRFDNYISTMEKDKR
ncbi:hypothetical protein KIMH_15090 [Bombiscardovia apis]|uniref:Uncharacterized protein n=1 Tax=Bombiscardovia apis TaxID=2932182 RepID=A0ABM8BEN6_9BIFI|nr:hypothetical protein KIMH_15090 [Bombiscardovia apis]